MHDLIKVLQSHKVNAALPLTLNWTNPYSRATLHQNEHPLLWNDDRRGLAGWSSAPFPFKISDQKRVWVANILYNFPPIVLHIWTAYLLQFAHTFTYCQWSIKPYVGPIQIGDAKSTQTTYLYCICVTSQCNLSLSVCLFIVTPPSTSLTVYSWKLWMENYFQDELVCVRLLACGRGGLGWCQLNRLRIYALDTAIIIH